MLNHFLFLLAAQVVFLNKKNTRFRVQSFPFGPTSFSKLSPLHSFCQLTKGCPSNVSIPLGLNKNKQESNDFDFIFFIFILLVNLQLRCGIFHGNLVIRFCRPNTRF
jgi:hypothetical protein